MRATIVGLALATAVAGCGASKATAPGGSSATSGAGGASSSSTSATTASSGGASSAAGGASTTSGTGGATSTTSAAGGAGGGTTTSTGPVAACKDIAAQDCFSSYDCPKDDRCQNVGTDAAPVPCCVQGARGPGAAGDACTGEADCESSLCVDGATGRLCTGKCTSDKDCPASLPKCIPIAFSGSNDLFCAP